jgi:hypothetical protein
MSASLPFRQSFPPFDIVGRDGFLPGIKAETAVGPGEELAELALADEFFPAQQGEETVAEKFGKRFESLNRQDVEAPLPIHQPGGGEDVEVGMKVEVVPEGLHGGDSGELAIGQLESDPHPITEALDGGREEVVEKFAPFAEDPAEGFRHRKHELPVRHLEAEDAGDPVAGRADFALMATWTEVAGLAGEGKEAFMPAVRTLEPGESSGEVSAAVELANDVNGVASQRSVNGAVALLVTGFEVGPAVVDELTPSMQSGFARYSCC